MMRLALTLRFAFHIPATFSPPALVGIGLLSLLATPCSLADSLQVQMNQVAFDVRGPKTAVVEYQGPAKAGTFIVYRGDHAVARGNLQALPAFAEWGEAKQYFALDYSQISQPGNYRVSVSVGALSAQSAEIKLSQDALFQASAKATLDYFKQSRHTGEADKSLRIINTERRVNVYGGWKDAGGDTGKYLSHLTYANFFNPQQASMLTWVLAQTYDQQPQRYRQAQLENAVLDELFWGADFMHRLVDPSGVFYTTVFDQWGSGERMVTGFEGIEGKYTERYQASFRAGGGMAIAALARAAVVAKKTARHGEFSAQDYLDDAERGFAHLQSNNLRYLPDGKENIIDDYCALMAATELYRATQKPTYLQAARQRAANLNQRVSAQGWFISDDKQRPYYHAVEAGLPILSLLAYRRIEPDPKAQAAAAQTVVRVLTYQLQLNQSVANPYNYARQNFRMAQPGEAAGPLQAGFFMPHKNETGYWWQGESARLASLASAASEARRDLAKQFKGARARQLQVFAQHQMDWLLGRNPYGICMLYGFGVKNSPSADSAGSMLVGGISNGITGADKRDDGSGIVFAPGPFVSGPEDQGWRWIEQWIPHSAWYLHAIVAMAQ